MPFVWEPSGVSRPTRKASERMFVVLDTNHYVTLIAGGSLASAINRRATAVDADLFTTIITPQGITQGWLAAINRETAGGD